MAFTPGATRTLYSVAAGRRGAFGVNIATRVSIQRHVPATFGVIVAKLGTSLPTAATATIGSENRTRTSDSARTSSIGRICGGARGAIDADACEMGASAIVLPVGFTNAIGSTLPARG